MVEKAPGIIIAAPSSGSGKTIITLGLLRLLAQFGLNPQAFKTGPDYIDPHYHSFASYSECHNLDPWAMRPLLISQLIARLGAHKLNIVEGVMGLFDGATLNSGSTADLAKHTGWPIVLVVDASRASHSLAALVQGFCNYRQDTQIKGLILNKIGSNRHKQMLIAALKPLNIPVIGAIPRHAQLDMPSRHLGLHQALEHTQINAFIDQTAAYLNQHIDLSLLQKLASDTVLTNQLADSVLDTVPPLGKRIAIAKDPAFSFLYPHFITSWLHKGCELDYFSPLNDEGPNPDCDAIFLPGGYPELHLHHLQEANQFKSAITHAVQSGKTIYAECGGHMVLGQSIIGADERTYLMTGVLPHQTSFVSPKMTLGYRQMQLASQSVFGHSNTLYKGHEFHYSSEIMQPHNKPLFKMKNASGDPLTATGIHDRNVYSSFTHLIDIAK